MAIVAGIDEAGYGPILGPLVASLAVFEVPDACANSCLWDMLRGAVSSKVHRQSRKLPIVDSKKLHHGQGGISAIETTALTMMACAGPLPQNVNQLFERICPTLLPRLQAYPWYNGLDDRLPLQADARALALKANAVCHEMTLHGMRFKAPRCRVLTAGHYNQLVRSTRNKASVLWALTLMLIHELIRQSRQPVLNIFIDRQGGRTHYTEALLTAFEEADLQGVDESAGHCQYHLKFNHQVVTLQFLQGGEEKKLPVALASIFSKYVRELMMYAFNRYWQRHSSTLRKTAGYYQDGRRFLKDIEPFIESLAIDRSMLVRSR